MQNSYIFIQENAFQNVVWKMAAILSQPQSVNKTGLRPQWVIATIAFSTSDIHLYLQYLKFDDTYGVHFIHFLWYQWKETFMNKYS